MLRTIETIGDNGQVALCADPYDLRAEHKALQRLREVGLPTFQTELKEVLVGDTEPLAEECLVGRRYAGHFLMTARRLIDTPMWARLEAARIMRRMIDLRIFATDPQFLYDDDGEVVLCDPETVFEDGERSAKMVQSYIDMYLKDIQDLRLL